MVTERKFEEICIWNIHIKSGNKLIHEQQMCFPNIPNTFFNHKNNKSKNIEAEFLNNLLLANMLLNLYNNNRLANAHCQTTQNTDQVKHIKDEDHRLLQEPPAILQRWSNYFSKISKEKFDHPKCWSSLWTCATNYHQRRWWKMGRQPARMTS